MAAVANFLCNGGRLAARPVHWILTGTLVAAVLSALSAGTLVGDGFFALLDRYGVVPFLLFVTAPVVYQTTDARSFLARGFTLFGAYLAAMAFFQVGGIHGLVWPRYILDPTVGLHFERARGPFVEGVANGMMLCFCAALAGIVASTDLSRRWRVTAAAVVPFALCAVLLTLTRAVWLGAAIAVVVVVLISPKLRRWAIVGGGIFAVAAFTIYSNVPGLAQLATDRGSDQWSLWDRQNTNRAALRMIFDNPLTGVGWHQSAERMQEFIRQGPDYPVTSASVGLEVHNVFLSRFAELGILAGGLWLVAFFSAVVYPILRTPEPDGLKPWRSALLPITIVWVSAAMFGPVPYPQPNYILWTMAGIVLTPYLTAPSPPRYGLERLR